MNVSFTVMSVWIVRLKEEEIFIIVFYPIHTVLPQLKNEHDDVVAKLLHKCCLVVPFFSSAIHQVLKLNVIKAECATERVEENS